MKIALTGDVMLGRLVDQDVVQNRSIRPESIWGDVLGVMLSADCRLINLECVISSKGAKWHPATKAFHFRAHPRAIEFLQAARIDGVTLANNHVLDFGPEALGDCMNLLDRHGIKRTGAGRTMEEALAPAELSFPEGRVAIIALTDNEPNWEASPSRTGVNYVSYGDRGLLEPYRSRIAQTLALSRQGSDFVIVSAHVGSNWGTPSRAMRALAHELIGMGADFYWGHSNHTPQGIELDTGRAILYSAGDFIDDYMVDRDQRNDLSFLFIVEVEKNRISKITLYPTAIEALGVRRATPDEWRFLARSMQGKCKTFGTMLRIEHDVGTISVR